MHLKLIFILVILFSSCKAQTTQSSTIKFTSDLAKFTNLSDFKASLKGVEIIALGENTHGLGEVFKAKADLVKFLHQELGFDVVLFESGFGDAALAWEKMDSLSPTEFTNAFTSNFYYHSEEIKNLVEYAKSQNKKLVIQGFDCQPQQNYLMQRMAEIIKSVDSVFAKTVRLEMRNFNRLYQCEYNKDTINFYKVRSRFFDFLQSYDSLLNKKQPELLRLGTTMNEINAIHQSIQIFRNTYLTIEFGSMMGWPVTANIRDKSLFETVKWFKEKNPEIKIIIWAQNSHIENMPKPNDNVKWMGHNLKEAYGAKYYSIGAIVYSGKSLTSNGTFEFEHNNKGYLVYYLNQYKHNQFILDVRNYPKKDFINKPLLDMDNNGNTTSFIAKDGFDGLLFIKHSDIPKLIEK
jgi:erythromycin esterase